MGKGGVQANGQRLRKIHLKKYRVVIHSLGRAEKRRRTIPAEAKKKKKKKQKKKKQMTEKKGKQ